MQKISYLTLPFNGLYGSRGLQDFVCFDFNVKMHLFTWKEKNGQNVNKIVQ